MDPRHIIDRIYDLAAALGCSAMDHRVEVHRLNVIADDGRAYSHQARLTRKNDDSYLFAVGNGHSPDEAFGELEKSLVKLVAAEVDTLAGSLAKLKAVLG